MISYLVQVAIGGIMKYEYPFDTYVEALRRFDALSRGTGSEAKDVWVVEYDDEAQEEFELAHKEVKALLRDADEDGSAPRNQARVALRGRQRNRKDDNTMSNKEYNYEVRIYYGIPNQRYELAIPVEYEHKADNIFYAFEYFMKLDPLKLITEVELRNGNKAIVRRFRDD